MGKEGFVDFMLSDLFLGLGIYTGGIGISLLCTWLIDRLFRSGAGNIEFAPTLVLKFPEVFTGDTAASLSYPMQT